MHPVRVKVVVDDVDVDVTVDVMVVVERKKMRRGSRCWSGLDDVRAEDACN